ncbi:RagB/SusD family nutrient uptake outer membrane protein [Marinoscillum furvescens]|uniref:Putative outer membrane starch-binding protein n=1 Tax=Marinoscillum furvescens DSM 4134 TaxID=1122208 RepID=A0A3D9L075_MARFU|nr:RagB/SusD family nutrient uptake outer membrane protein [Marinoscillum furvescens]RED96569.1 putative outer membrane starch-binding protein [Marinoscillum furvescens DSM 4134]
MKNQFFLLTLVGLMLGACEDFLEVSPKGELSENVFETSEDAVEGVVIGVYSMLNGQYNQITNAHRSGPSNWVYGDVVSDDAYKGSSGISDGSDVHQLEVFQADASVQAVLVKWEACYEGISRANRAINIISNFPHWSESKKNLRLAEVRVLRGHYYFELKKVFDQIAYIDETMSVADLKKVTNTAYTSDQLWDKIEADFRFGAQHLPAVQADVGRMTSVVANAYLAKSHLFQQEWAAADAALDEVIANPGQHHLMSDFEQIFLLNINENGAEFCPECIFSVQHSLDPTLPSSTPDVGATYGWDGNVGDRLSGLGGPYPRVYGFHKPSQNLVNAFKTNADGLPVIDFNRSNVSLTTPVDPRLDHTVGRPGIPFLDAGIYEESWTRGVSTYGPFAGKKQLYSPSGNQVMDIPYYTNSENYCILRFADVYLMKAEVLIEQGDLNGGRAYINLVRERAKNAPVVTAMDSSPAAPYAISTYDDSFASYEEAIWALRTERRLEFAMEGHRFFDLVRWGIAKDVMNEYLRVEKTRRPYMESAIFEKKHEYFPIPATEVDLSEGRFTQRKNY